LTYNANHPNRRSTDNGRLSDILAQIGRLKALWYLVGLLLIAFGFDFKTPAQHFKEIESVLAQQRQEVVNGTAERSALQHTQSSLRANQDTMSRDILQLTTYIRALAIAQCLDRPQRELQLMGLPCTRWLSERNR
jgi:hypothetical protein